MLAVDVPLGADTGTFAIKSNFTKCYIETMPNMISAQKLYLKKGFEYIDKPLWSSLIQLKLKNTALREQTNNDCLSYKLVTQTGYF